MVDGRRALRRVAGIAAAVLVASSCGSDGSADEADGPLTVPPTLAGSTTTTVPAPSTTISDGLPVEHLASCVENAKYQAFIGNEFWAAMWTDAGMTSDGMVEVCRFLGEGDPATLADIHDTWQALQAATTTTSTTTTTEPREAPVDGAADPSLVAGCTAWVEFFAERGVPRAIELWEAAGGALSTVRELCTDIAQNDPTEARQMRDEMEGAGP